MNRPTHVIGILGIGNVGLPMAINLMRAGYRVVGVQRPEHEPFVRNGGEELPTAAEVARLADFVILSLPSEEIQRQMLQGSDGMLSGLAPGKVVIEMGTYRREVKLAQARQVEARGAEMLEAEISGSPPMLAERRAALYIGGDEALLERCMPVLEAITNHQFFIGELGSAVAMKLIANHLVAVHTLAAAEAMNIGVRAGFNPHRVAEVIKQGAGNSMMFTIRAPMMASRTFTPAPGPFLTLEKYLRMGAALAQELGCATPLLSVAAPYYLRAIEGGMGAEDISAVIKLLEADSTDLPTSLDPQ